MILVFPTNCKSYLEPHSVECHRSLWKNAGCTEEGTDYPDDLDTLNNDLFRSDLK